VIALNFFSSLASTFFFGFRMMSDVSGDSLNLNGVELLYFLTSPAAHPVVSPGKRRLRKLYRNMLSRKTTYSGVGRGR